VRAQIRTAATSNSDENILHRLNQNIFGRPNFAPAQQEHRSRDDVSQPIWVSVASVIWEIVMTALKGLALAAALIVGTSSVAMAQAQGLAPGHPDYRVQMAIFGSVYIGIATVIHTAIVVLAAQLRPWLQPFPDGSKIAKLQWKFKKSTEAPFDVDVPDVFSQAFVIEKDAKRFPNSGGWGYALFNYEAASDRFTADPSPSDCGHACHMAVKAKDYIFHPYQKR